MTEACVTQDLPSYFGATTDEMDGVWAQLERERPASYRDIWRSVAEVLGQSEGGMALLRSLKASLECQTKEVLRASYWRGYHAGYREAAGDVLPIFGQSQEPARPGKCLASGLTAQYETVYAPDRRAKEGWGDV